MNSPSPPASFDVSGLDANLLRAVHEAGYHLATPIQMAAIPAVLAGRDLLARAPTGSGKTAAFGLPLLQRLCERPRGHSARGNPVAVLVLAPTRELVMQIGEVLNGFGRHLSRRIRLLTVYGGVSLDAQMMALRGGADILVATPGRLLDLHRHNAVAWDALQALVLDEADRMLSLGFRDELGEIIALLPEQRQNLLFSATFPPELMELAQGLLREPLEIEPERAAESEPQIEQHVYTVAAERKSALLIHLIQQKELRRVLVFVSAKKTGDVLGAKLLRAGLRAAVFHGDKSQAERSKGLAGFRAGTLHVLIATDLAGRGLDIDTLPVVINYELPRSPNDYVHRIGRTGRAGQAGLAISLITSAEEQHFRVIEKRMKHRLAREQIPGF